MPGATIQEATDSPRLLSAHYLRGAYSQQDCVTQLGIYSCLGTEQGELSASERELDAHALDIARRTLSVHYSRSSEVQDALLVDPCTPVYAISVPQSPFKLEFYLAPWKRRLCHVYLDDSSYSTIPLTSTGTKWRVMVKMEASEFDGKQPWQQTSSSSEHAI